MALLCDALLMLNITGFIISSRNSITTYRCIHWIDTRFYDYLIFFVCYVLFYCIVIIIFV